MGWKIPEIEEGNKLKLFLDNIVVFKENDKIIISLSTIDVLLITNYKTMISVPIINALSQNNILVIICDNNYLPCSQIVPIIGNYNTLKIFEKQLSWNHNWKSNIWSIIIKQKIEHQAWFVKNRIKNNERAEQIIQLTSQIKAYDISNREGHAAKIYWHSFFGIGFSRDNDDFYYNKLLNYGYTVLRAYFTRSIIKKGLDPRVSIFHKSFHNYFALASDLMEPFRFVVDDIIFNIFQTGEVNFYEHKQLIIENFNSQINFDNKIHYISNAIDIFVDKIVSQSELPIIDRV